MKAPWDIDEAAVIISEVREALKELTAAKLIDGHMLEIADCPPLLGRLLEFVVAPFANEECHCALDSYFHSRSLEELESAWEHELAMFSWRTALNLLALGSVDDLMPVFADAQLGVVCHLQRALTAARENDIWAKMAEEELDA